MLPRIARLFRGDSDTIQGSVPEVIPVSNHPVSHDPSLDDIQYIKTILKSKKEQQKAKDLEPEDALKYVELLDQVLRAGSLDEKDRPTCIRYLARVCGWHSILPDSVRISNHQREIQHDGGGHSVVWIGRYNGRKVSIKVFNVYLSYSDIKRREITKAFCKEVVIWKNLSHPNILPFIGAAMVTVPNRENYEIVSEFMENGNITTFLKVRQNAGVNRLELLKDVAEGLRYLHSQEVVHGDLKGLNVLINNHRRACLADFGLTRIIADFTSSGPGDQGGTVAWMSPELLCPGDGHGKPTKESDVYSLGILIYEVICDHVPFPGDGWSVMEKIQKGIPRPKVGFTDPLWETLEICWKRDPKERPNTATVLKRLDEALKG